jgi:hypothetical protein
MVNILNELSTGIIRNLSNVTGRTLSEALNYIQVNKIGRDEDDQINQYTEKTNINDNDVMLLEDSEDGYSKKKCLVSSFEAGIGHITNASNVGAGDGVFKDRSGSILRFKSLIGGSGVTLTPGTNDITLSAKIEKVGALPAASVDYEGRFYIVEVGGEDVVYICLKAKDTGFHWVPFVAGGDVST